MKNASAGASRRLILQGMAGTLASSLTTIAAPAAFSQSGYPNRVIRMVVTLPAGTSADAMARFISEQLASDLGQPVIVDNRPGASSTIGTRAVAAEPADGHTLLYGLAPALSLNPHLFKNLPYKPSDFTPISHILDVPFVLVVPASSPYRTVQDLFGAAKATPDKLQYPSYGVGSPNHVAMLQMLEKTGASMIHVPYRDGGLNDLLGGRLDCSLDVTAMAMPHVAAGTLRALVVSTPDRLAVLPNVPTFGDLQLGEPLFSWNGLFVRSGTAPEIVARLASAMQRITARADFQQKVADFVQVPRGGTPGQFAEFLARDLDNWGKIIARANIRLD
jgi:tripartite-type tricarboxylate transporter receptor subunit TctC